MLRRESTCRNPPLCTIERGVATLELPHDRLDEPTARDLCDAAVRIEMDDDVTVVVLRGRGASFCIGVDKPGTWQKQLDCFSRIAALSAPAIAEVGGDAIDDGCAILLAADLRVAATTARFRLRLPRTKSATHRAIVKRLEQIVGRPNARTFLASARSVSARAALRIGLVERVVPPDQLRAIVRREATAMAARGPIALRYAKEAVWKGLDMSFEQGMRLEQDLYVLLQTTADRREGIRSFLGKRRPRFVGR